LFDHVGVDGCSNTGAWVPTSDGSESITSTLVVNTSLDVVEGSWGRSEHLIQPRVDESERSLASEQLNVVQVSNLSSNDGARGRGTSNTFESSTRVNAVRDSQAKDGGDIGISAAGGVIVGGRREVGGRVGEVTADGRGLVGRTSKGVGKSSTRVGAAGLRTNGVGAQVRSTNGSDVRRSSRKVRVESGSAASSAPDTLVTRGEHDGQSLNTGSLELGVALVHV